MHFLRNGFIATLAMAMFSLRRTLAPRLKQLAKSSLKSKLKASSLTVIRQLNGRRLEKEYLMVRYVFTMLCVVMLIVPQGTAPFMSIRALNHWLKGLKKVEKHTAIDDLESFMWLLIWYLLQAGHSSQSLSEEEQAAFNNFDSASYNQVLMIKYELRTMLVDYDSSMPPPFNTVAFLAPFMGILKPWADTIIKAQKLMANIVVQAYRQNAMDNTTTHKTMEDLCIKALNECINTGLKEVEGIKENWDDYKLSK